MTGFFPSRGFPVWSLVGCNRRGSLCVQALFLFVREQLMNVLDEQVLHSGLITHRVFLETSVKVGVDVHLNPFRASAGITDCWFEAKGASRFITDPTRATSTPNI